MAYRNMFPTANYLSTGSKKVFEFLHPGLSLKPLISLFIAFLFWNITGAQVKYEKEYRIDAEEVPATALQFIAALDFPSKVKWYKEEGFQKTSIEAKTKDQLSRFSIEFSSSGLLEDIEIKCKWEQLPVQVRTSIAQYFSSNFQKHKIRKIQVQYQGQADALKAIRTNRPKSSTQQMEVRYELVVKVKRKDTYQLLELLFDDRGNYLQEWIIILKNTDNLEY